jgi:hypothetical protein
MSESPQAESTGTLSTPPSCSCGFTASDADEMTDHLLYAFALDTDIAPDGTRHVPLP